MAACRGEALEATARAKHAGGGGEITCQRLHPAPLTSSPIFPTLARTPLALPTPRKPVRSTDWLVALTWRARELPCRRQQRIGYAHSRAQRGGRAVQPTMARSWRSEEMGGVPSGLQLSATRLSRGSRGRYVPLFSI